MNFSTRLIAAVCFCLNFIQSTALADTVFLKNGKVLTVEKVWQEGDQIRLIYHGLDASLAPGKVLRIENDAKGLKKTVSPEPHEKTAQKIYDPPPAGKILPDQGSQTAETVAGLPAPTEPPSPKPVLRIDGFDNLTWGARVGTVQGLEKKQGDSGFKGVIEYIRPNDRLELGEATLQSIVYAFWRDQLYTVTVWTRGLANFQALRQAAIKQFGAGVCPEPSIQRYLWSDGPSDMMLEYSQEGQNGMLWMRGKELDRKFKLSKISGPNSYLKWMKSRN